MTQGLSQLHKKSDGELYLLAAAVWGVENQLFQAMEELGELIQAISHYHRKDNLGNRDKLIEEITDTEIMLSQVKLIANIKPEDLERMKKIKLCKLGNMLMGELNGRKVDWI